MATDETDPKIVLNAAFIASTLLSLRKTKKRSNKERDEETDRRHLRVSTDGAAILFFPPRETLTMEGVIAKNC